MLRRHYNSHKYAPVRPEVSHRYVQKPSVIVQLSPGFRVYLQHECLHWLVKHCKCTPVISRARNVTLWKISSLPRKALNKVPGKGVHQVYHMLFTHASLGPTYSGETQPWTYFMMFKYRRWVSYPKEKKNPCSLDAVIYYSNRNVRVASLAAFARAILTIQISSSYADLGHWELALRWDWWNISLIAWNALYRTHIFVFLRL